MPYHNYGPNPLTSDTSLGQKSFRSLRSWTADSLSYPRCFESHSLSLRSHGHAEITMVLEKIAFGTKSLPGYIGGPKGKPAVIVLQEWWGITEEVKRQAQKISTTKSVRVLVPDLYKGKMGVNAEEASHLMNNLDFPQAVEEIKEAVQHLRSEGSPKISAIGFCMGGALALLAAEHAKIESAVGFYGTPDPKLGHPEKVTVPVQTHSGAKDTFKGFADPATVKPWTEKVPNGNGQFFEYPDEGHAFMNEGEDVKKLMKTGDLPTDIDSGTRDLAWSRVFEFLDRTLL